MDEQWPTEWLRGVLELAVLRALLEGPTYGYALGVRLTTEGLGTVKGGTLYPLLTRLEDNGLLTTQWRAGEGGPGRKYFEITDAGRERFARDRMRWDQFTRAAHHFICAEEDA